MLNSIRFQITTFYVIAELANFGGYDEFKREKPPKHLLFIESVRCLDHWAILYPESKTSPVEQIQAEAHNLWSSASHCIFDLI